MNVTFLSKTLWCKHSVTEKKQSHMTRKMETASKLLFVASLLKISFCAHPHKGMLFLYPDKDASGYISSRTPLTGHGNYIAMANLDNAQNKTGSVS